MDTTQEALFKAMLSDGWFTESDGNVESPTGYFGYVHTHANEVNDVRDAFSHVINLYGGQEAISDSEIAGVYVARINDQGIIFITKMGGANSAGLAWANDDATKLAQRWFATHMDEFEEWENN